MIRSIERACLLLCQLTLYMAGSNYHTNNLQDVTFLLEPGSPVRNITSPGFPSCCQPTNISVICTSSPCSIRLVFSDLDIPLGSRLTVFDGTKRFVEQPQLFNGVWHRPTYSSTGHNILLQFNPDLKRVINYSGFRFSAWRTLDYYWDDKPTSVGCGVLRSAIMGETVSVVFPSHFLESSEITQDCVWILKPPPHNTRDTYVYVRFIALSGLENIQILEGVTSYGRTIVLDLPTFHLDLEGIKVSNWGTAMYKSSRGMYIRAVINNKLDVPATFTFVYGILQESTFDMTSTWCEPETGKPTGFWCTNEHLLCLPEEHRCNEVRNCPGGEDEDRDTCKRFAENAAAAKFVSPSVFTSTNHPNNSNIQAMATRNTRELCSHLFPFACLDGIGCFPHGYICDGYFDCNDRSDEAECVSDYECRSYEKQCLTNECVYFTARCPEEPCEFDMYRCEGGVDCYRESQRCDSFNDCPNGIDEDNCTHVISQNRNLWGLLSLLVVVIGITVYRCRNLGREEDASHHDREHARENVRCLIQQLTVPWEMSMIVVFVLISVVAIIMIYLKRCYFRRSTLLAAQFSRPPHSAARNSVSNSTTIRSGNYDLIALEMRTDDDSTPDESLSPPPPYDVAMKSSVPLTRQEDSDDEPPPPTYESVTAASARERDYT